GDGRCSDCHLLQKSVDVTRKTPGLAIRRISLWRCARRTGDPRKRKPFLYRLEGRSEDRVFPRSTGKQKTARLVCAGSESIEHVLLYGGIFRVRAYFRRFAGSLGRRLAKGHRPHKK